MNVFKRIIEMYEDHKTRSFIVALCNTIDRTQFVVMNELSDTGKERCAITNRRIYCPQHVAANNADYNAHHRKLAGGAILKRKGGTATTELIANQNVGMKSGKTKCWLCSEAIDMLAKFRTEVLIPNMELEEGKTVTVAPKVKISSFRRKPVGTLADVLAHPKPQQRKRASKQGVAIEYREVTT
jgi:hypothetical protein